MCGRKAKQSTHQAPEARHRTHSPAQRTPPAAGATAGAPRKRATNGEVPHGGKAENVGSLRRAVPGVAVDDEARDDRAGHAGVGRAAARV
ncbi:hypothetical protein BG653_05714 [Streptomyces platensis]|uniref:Uncharacterized protein n=1 Tax=Streptomyces platensis TaxID=58346 RepID=A0ABX3XPS4_STRPT|nr:hypothetical protein BG653_05714 [Streptomyces platensis]